MNCLFCGSGRIEKASYPRPTVFNNKQFHYRSCMDCGLVFIDPLPTSADYDKMYAADYHSEFYFNETPPDYTNWFNLLEKYSKEKQVLDYGCGDGSFVKFFQKKGYECTGVEYDPALVARLKKENPGISFYTVDEFQNLGGHPGFNVIFMGDVLEHISTPADFLKSLMPKLKKNGLIAAQGPLEDNANLALRFRKFISAVKTSLSKSSVASHVPYHIFFSNARNQKAVFEQAGLQTKYYEVFETTWPFPEKFSASPVAGMQYLIARTSKFLSKTLPGNMGNRFLYIGEKK